MHSALGLTPKFICVVKEFRAFIWTTLTLAVLECSRIAGGYLRQIQTRVHGSPGITKALKQSNVSSRRHQQGRIEQSDEEKTEGLCEHIKVTSTREYKQMVTEKPKPKHIQVLLNSVSQANHQTAWPVQPSLRGLYSMLVSVLIPLASVCSDGQVGIPGARDRILRSITWTLAPDCQCTSPGTLHCLQMLEMIGRELPLVSQLWV